MILLVMDLCLSKIKIDLLFYELLATFLQNHKQKSCIHFLKMRNGPKNERDAALSDLKQVHTHLETPILMF